MMTESLLERQPVLADVAECLGHAKAGEGQALCLIGEAGLGKTSILRAAARLAGDDFEVMEGCGYPMESAIPFGLARQVFERLGRDADGAFPDHGDGLVMPDPSAPFLRTLKTLRGRDGPPLLLLFDDLHCADPDSLRLIAFLVRRLACERIGLIAALRPWPPAAGDAVRELEAAGAVSVRQLGQLGPVASDRLLSRSAGATLDRETKLRARHLCGGNPLLIEQLGAAISRGGDVPLDELKLGSPDKQLLLARFAGIDRRAVAVLGAASAIGERFRLDTAARVSELEPEVTDAAIEEICRSGLVTEDGSGSLRFTHPLLRQVLYDDLPAPLRRRLHARIFRLFAASGRDELAAEQAIKADLIGDEEAAALLERVGRAAAEAGAIATAALNLKAAIRFRGSRCGSGLLFACAEALLALARADEAAAIGRQMLSIRDLPWRERVATLRMLGHADYLTGSPDLGDERMDEAVKLAIRGRSAEAVGPLLDHASIVWMARGPAAALPKTGQALRLADRVEPHRRDAIIVLHAHLKVECGDPGALREITSLGRRYGFGGVEDRLDLLELNWPAAAIYGYAHCEKYAERFDRSVQALQTARGMLEQAGEANGIATVTLFIAKQLLWQGRLEAALDEAARAAEFSELTPVALPFGSLIRAEALAHIGDFAASDRYRQAALAQASSPDLWLVRLWSGLVSGLCLLRQGDPRASAEFLEVERIAAEAGLLEPSSQPWAGHAVSAHLAGGRTEDATRITVMLEQCARDHPARWPRAVSALSRGRLDESGGDLSRAENSYRIAVELLKDVDLPLERADALVALGSLIRRSGRVAESRSPLAEALTLADAAGAGWLAGTVHAELKLAGGRRRRNGMDRDLLTPAELRVARKVAAGHTNAEVGRLLHLSANTVRSHLKRIYGKLGIHSRRELVGLDLDRFAGRH